MRNFYLSYKDSEKLAPLVREISWSNNILIMEKCKSDLERVLHFDFAELSPEYTEHELEIQLINHIREFLTEMGGDFTFVGNQYHLIVGHRDLYIDLLLFHRRLRSLIAVELKIGEFEAEHAGKMQLYLTALDELVKLPEENPSIGIIDYATFHLYARMAKI